MSSPAYNAAWRARNKTKLQTYMREWHKNHRPLVNLTRRNKTRQLREAAISAYGGKCYECGFDDHRALQFDHVNNDGARERGGRYWEKNENGVRFQQRKLYMKLSNNPGLPDYQLLCANCHAIKTMNEYEAKHALAS